MKKFLSAIICLLMVVQIVGVMALPAAAGATGNSLYNSSNVWVVEYDNKASTDDYGYRASTSPSLKDGVLAFERGDGIRLNWANIEGFDSFDANKTYTFTFDVKVTDFGQDVPFEASAAWNREFYFAPGGYYNQIEFRSGNYTNQLGLRAGDKSDTYAKGGWNNDLSTYKLDTVYNCTVEWKPSEGAIISTVKNGDEIIVQGARTSNDYKTYNKYTRSFIWRCEDGAMELDNVTLTDGSKTFTEGFDYATEEPDRCKYSAAFEEGFDNTQLFSADIGAILNTELPFYGNGSGQGNGGWFGATSPTLLEDGKLLFKKSNGMSFYPANIEGFEYSADKVYTIKFDVELLEKSDGVDLTGGGWNRELYFGFGGYYNQVEFKSAGSGIRAGDKAEGFDQGGWNNNKDFALGKYSVEVVWSPADKSVISTVKQGEAIVARGIRSGAQYVRSDMNSMLWTLRCEGGSFKLENLSISNGDKTYKADLAKDFVDAADRIAGTYFTLETAFYGNKSNSKLPTVENGVLKLDTQESVAFRWKEAIGGRSQYSSAVPYTFEFDVKVTGEGNGSNWGNSNHTGILYVAFGGYFDQIRFNNVSSQMWVGEKTSAYSSDTYLNKTVHVKIELKGTSATSTITDAEGNVLATGTRSGKTDYAADNNYMTSIALRCEDGSVEIDNFKFFAEDPSIFGEHTRDESKVVGAVEANCTNKGYTGDTVCKYCGKEMKGAEIAANGKHNYGAWISQKDATCTADGTLGHYNCAVCDKNFDAEYNELASLTIKGGHNYGKWIEKVDATCAKDGTLGHYHCAVCDKNFDAEYKELASLTIKGGHNYGKWIEKVDATCTKDGTLGHYTCSVCNKNFDADHKELASLTIKGGHNYGEWIEKVDATCTEDGTLGHYTCSACNKSFDADHNELTSLTIEAAGHSYGEWATTKEPTTEAEGEKQRECANCDSVETEKIDKLPAENEGEDKETEEPTEEPTEKPTEEPTEKPTETDAATEDKATEDEGGKDSGCGGTISISAVVITALLGMGIVIKKRD